MSTITLPNIRVSSDLTVGLKLKDGGVAIDWSTLSNIRVSIYADAQRSLAGRCTVAIDETDSTVLVCQYAANKPQYLGVNRVIVQCTYMGETKTYDKPAFTFVRWTDDQEGEEITISDPDVDVEIEVEDVSSSILNQAIAAALQAAEDAEHAAHLIPNQVLLDCEQATTDANAAAAAANAAGITSVQVSVEDNEPGTPSAECSLANKVLSVIFHYLKGETGDAAGFGTISASFVEDGGDPSVLVTASGPDTAKNIAFTLKNFKGDKGDKGDQGNTGSSVDYPFEIVNNCTTDDATKALSAAQGKALKDEVSQLEAQVVELALGNFLGFYPSAEDLPTDGDNPGYAYVGASAPYAVYNYDGTSWSDSGSIFKDNRPVYLIENSVWGITEGYMGKDQDGHYSQAQYGAMYNNGLGFTNAIKWAFDNGYSGVCFTKGTYCFCPFGGTIKYNEYGSINIQNVSYFDIDLNGAELCVLVDSSTKSPYIQYTTNNPYEVASYCILRLTCCEHLTVHNGVLVGDKKTRSFTNANELKEEQTYGIAVGHFCFYVNIFDMDISYFMGDAIETHGAQQPMVDYTYPLHSGVGSANPGTITAGGFKQVNYVISADNSQGKATSGYIDLSNLYSVGLDNPIIKECKEKKLFTINNNSGYTRFPDCYLSKIVILTYESENGDPLRYIESSFLDIFQLQGNENGIRLMFFYEYNIPQSGISETKIRITPIVSHDINIHHCNIVNNHRGGISGGCNNVTIDGCKFFKDSVNPFPNTTNYSINFEDAMGNYLLVKNCDFSSAVDTLNFYGNQGSILYAGKKLVVADSTLETSPYIYNCLFADVYGNTIKKAGGYCNAWLNGLNNESARYNKRIYKLHNCKVYCFDLPQNNDALTYISIYDNFVSLAHKGLNYVDESLSNTSVYNNEIDDVLDKSGTSTTVSRNYIPARFSGNNIRKTHQDIGLVLWGITHFDSGVFNTIRDGITVEFPTLDYGGQMRIAEFIAQSGGIICTGQMGGDFNYDVLIEKCVLMPGSQFIIRRYFKNTGDKTSYITIRDCDIRTVMIFSYTVNTTLSGVLFDGCDFTKLEGDYIWNGLPVAFMATYNISFKNCKFRETQKMSSNFTYPIQAKKGVTAARPLYVEDGYVYFDTDLGKPIFKDTPSSTGWVDATGAEV